MLQEDLEAVRRATEAFNRRDVEVMLEELDAEMMREQDELFAEIALEYSEAREVGDKLVAIGILRARGKQSGIATRTSLDPDEALESAEPRE